MDSKSILLAIADPQLLVDITQALSAEWEATSVSTEADALAQFEKQSFDALLVDFNLGSPDASEVLNQIWEKSPDTIRFLLAYEADLALVAAKVLGSPHILPKPIESASLKSRLENAVNEKKPKESGTEPAKDSTNSLPIPSIYSDVLKAIESLGTSDQQIAEIISRDPALTSELLRLTNSAYLGLPRNLTDPVEAVESLGLETVKALIMALQFLAEHSRLKPGYLSFAQIWEHSVKVGQLARDLVLFETKDRTLALQALTAGLLHDLGKVVLVTNFDDLYGRVHSLARKQPVALWDIEKEMFGANHGEIGACLIGMWNMPSAVVEAAALHHEPPLGEQEQLTPLAAVHIANILEHELHPSDDDLMVAPIINTPYLNELGLLQRLPVWRAAFANRTAENLELETESAETASAGTAVVSTAPELRTANNLPAPDAPTMTTTSGHGSRDGTGRAGAAPSQKHWVYAGIVAAVLVLLALWFRTQTDVNQIDPAYARTTNSYQAPPVVATTTTPPETTPAALPQPTTAVAVPEETPAQPAAAAPVPEPVDSQPAPEPPAPTAPKPAVANVPPPTVTSQEKPLPGFRVNAIIYARVHPSAIVNGATVTLGDEIDGAKVVGITSTAVTLQFNHQRKTYELR